MCLIKPQLVTMKIYHSIKKVNVLFIFVKELQSAGVIIAYLAYMYVYTINMYMPQIFYSQVISN